MILPLEQLKYPIGRFQPTATSTQVDLERWIAVLEVFPQQLYTELENLSEADLEKQYRPDGWSIKQVVHHCADSHMNSFIRFKLALTEDTPTVKPYEESVWAELPEAKTFSVASSLSILAGLHSRWVYLLRNLQEEDWDKAFFHPESQETVSLRANLDKYAWHCEHHLAHIILAKQQ